jgi:hypothetical protein
MPKRLIKMSELLYRLQELVKMVEPKTKGASVNCGGSSFSLVVVESID